MRDFWKRRCRFRLLWKNGRSMKMVDVLMPHLPRGGSLAENKRDVPRKGSVDIPFRI